LPGRSGIPRTVVLTVSFVVSLVTGLSCHHRRQIIHRLDTSVGVSVARFPKFVRYPRPHFRELRKAQGNCDF